MKLIKSFAIAFSIYSKIPMPHFPWNEKDRKYVLCFFPLVGAVIGGLFVFWAWLCRELHIGSMAYVLVAVAIPLMVTGGFHVDGFMDTMDAVHSYQDRERKLEILKDSHIGAFSVIMLLLYYFVYIAAFSEVSGRNELAVVGIGFMLSRCLSGIGVLVLRSAKKDGMLSDMKEHAEKKKVLVVLFVQLALCIAGMLFFSLSAGFFALAGAFFSFLYYHYMSYKEFGGITGDTAGYFVLVCELLIVVFVAGGSLIWR